LWRCFSDSVGLHRFRDTEKLLPEAHSAPPPM
jgi:hypothetical protein